MSIPSVRFKPPARKISMQRSGPIQSGVNRHRPSTPAMISFDLSSSDESSDDLPMIQSNLKNQMQDIPLDSSSSDEIGSINNNNNNNDDDDDSNKKYQVNWASKNPKPKNLVSQKNNNNLISNSGTNSDSQPSQHSQQDQQPNAHHLAIPSEEHANNPSDSGQTPQRKRKRVRRVRVPQQTEGQHQNPDNVQQNANVLEQEVEVIRNRSHQSQVHNNVQNHFSNPENVRISNHENPQLSQTNPQIRTNITTKVVDISNYQPNSYIRQRNSTFSQQSAKSDTEVISRSENIDTFTVVKELKHSRKNSADFRMMKNENVVYFARVSKDDIGIYYNVSKSLPIVPNSPEIVGQLRKQNHGKRYTVYSISEKACDDRDPETLGMSFVKNPDYKSKQKTFRIAYRKDGHINYPISKRRELSRIADDLQSNFKEIETLFNKPPTIGPDGNPVSSFGSMFVVDSIKNYVINDENDRTIFMIFKSSEASYTVKTRFPFSPLMAFGLSIAIIEDCH